MQNQMPITQMLFRSKGRITRSPFWLYSIGLNVVVDMAIELLPHFSVGEGPPYLGLLLMLGIFTAFIWAEICITAKRCHDRNQSGWFLFIVLFPVFGWMWLIAEVGFMDGTQGPNQYGSSPKGIGEPLVADVFS